MKRAQTKSEYINFLKWRQPLGRKLHLNRSEKKSDAHSHRSATIGFTLVARRAGIQQANSATAISKSVITANVIGSVGGTSNNRDFIHLVSEKAAVNPITTPMNTCFNPCMRTSFSTSPDCAPSAIRMPSSCVRCLTEYEVTP